MLGMSTMSTRNMWIRSTIMGIQSNFGEYNRDIMDYIIGYTVILCVYIYMLCTVYALYILVCPSRWGITRYPNWLPFISGKMMIMFGTSNQLDTSSYHEIKKRWLVSSWKHRFITADSGWSSPLWENVVFIIHQYSSSVKIVFDAPP